MRRFAKAVTVLAGSALAILSVCLLVPAPNGTLLPLMVVAPEVSPWLMVLNLAVGAAAVRFSRPMAWLAFASFLIVCRPMLQMRDVAILVNPERQAAGDGRVNRAAIFFDCFRVAAGGEVRPRRLPGNALYYAPQRGVGLRPAVVDLYGGAWQRGSPGDTHHLDAYLAKRGFAVFAIDYRHAPQFQFPVQLEDVRAALRFVWANAAQYRADRNRLVLCGHSSGAELALLAAYEANATPVRAVVSYYGPTDLAAGYYDPPAPDPIDVQAVLRAYVGGTPRQDPDAFRRASPVNAVRRGLPATLLLQGERDHVVKARFARELYERLAGTGNRVELVEIPWSEHAFDVVFFGLGNRLSLCYLDGFLADAVGN